MVKEKIEIRSMPRRLFRSVKMAVSKPATDENHLNPLELLLAARPKDELALIREYNDSQLKEREDTFVLYRVIGNDLYPRHKKGQSRENLEFLLQNEPELADCEKNWIVNRIVDPDEESRIIGMLDAFGQRFIRIPFIAQEYKEIRWDFDILPSPNFFFSEEFSNLDVRERERLRLALYRLKNNYIMNNNGARNAALRDGRGRAKWILPWDGNCFITPRAWQDIRGAVTTRPHLKYFVVPMDRVMDNAVLLRDDFVPHPAEEPQLVFRCDAREEFHTEMPYGRRPKVELFWRLGIPGQWDHWEDDPWDQERRELSAEAYQFGVAGWTARMFSGIGGLEDKGWRPARQRYFARQDAIFAAIDAVDRLVHGCLD